MNLLGLKQVASNNTHNKALLSQPSAAGTAHCVVRPKAWRYAKEQYMKMIYKSLFILFTLYIQASYAEGVADNLTVYQVRVDQSGMGYVHFSSALTGTPATCASSHPKQLAFDANTDGGKAILSMALSAKMSGKKIYASGTGSCEGYNVVERWNTGYLRD